MKDAETGSSAEALEEVGGFGLESESADPSKARRFVQMQIFLPRKEAILMEEIRLRRMKKGQDLSRSRLVSEAIHLLAERDSAARIGGKDD